MIRSLLFGAFALIIFKNMAQSPDTLVIEEEPIVVHKEVYYTKPPLAKQSSIMLGYGLPNFTSENENKEMVIGGSMIHLAYDISINNWVQGFGLSSSNLMYNEEFEKQIITENTHNFTHYDTTVFITVKYDTVEGGIYGPGTKTIYIDSTIDRTIVQKDSSYSTFDTTYSNSERTHRVTYYSFSYSLGRRFIWGENQVQITLDLMPSIRVYNSETDFSMTYGGYMSAGRLFYNDRLLAGISMKYVRYEKSNPEQSASNIGIMLKYLF